MGRKHNYGIMVNCCDENDVFKAVLFPDIHALSEEEAINEALKLAKKQGLKDVSVTRAIPGAVQDYGLVPLYNYKMIVDYYHDGHFKTIIVRNIEADTDKEALNKTEDYFHGEYPEGHIFSLSIGEKKDNE